MTYEYNEAGDLWLLSDFCEQLQGELEFAYPAEVHGMRALDYAPDTDDYEYQQSRLY